MGLSRGGAEVDLLEASKNRFEAGGHQEFVEVAGSAIRKSISISIPISIVASIAFSTSVQAIGSFAAVLLFAAAIVPGALLLLEIEILRGAGLAAGATILQTGAIQLFLVPVALVGLGGTSGFALAFFLTHIVVVLLTGILLHSLLSKESAEGPQAASQHQSQKSMLIKSDRRWVILVEVLRVALVWAPLLLLYWRGSPTAILEFSVTGRLAAAVGLLVPAFLNYLAPLQIAKHQGGADIPLRVALIGALILTAPAVVFSAFTIHSTEFMLGISGIESLEAEQFLSLFLFLVGTQLSLGIASLCLQDRLIARLERRAAMALCAAFSIVLSVGILVSSDFDSFSAAAVAVALQAGAVVALLPLSRTRVRWLSS